jgi:hypothetical protein
MSPPALSFRPRLFLHRFYRDDPWKQLRKIYDSVISDF